MIAIGKPMVLILIENDLSFEEYCILYCYVYNKVDVLESYSAGRNMLPVFKLKEKGYLNIKPQSMRIKDASPTNKGITFIKNLVDSYTDQKSDNPLLSDENLLDLADNIYGAEFNTFFATYPVKVRRINGREDNLREGKKEIKQLYLTIIQQNKVTPQKLQKILEIYIKEKKKTGSVAYLKTLRNWLKQDIWRDVIEWVASKQSTNNDKDIDYGGKLI
jgi:hypothetical protein